MLKTVISFLCLILSLGASAQCTATGGFQCTTKLKLYLPPQHYPNYNIPINANFTSIDAFAATTVVVGPTASQTVVQPVGTAFNVNSLILTGVVPVLRFGTLPDVWDTAVSRTAAGELSVDTNSVGNAAGKLKANSFNSSAGFQYQGAAPLGHILIGDGQHYVDSAVLPSGYNLVQNAGVALTPRYTLNVTAPLTAVDDSANARTIVALAPTAVTPGSYASANITVDQYGRITSAITGGSALGTITEQTGSRTCGVTYQNISNYAMYVSVTSTVNGNSGATLSAYGGANSPSINLATVSIVAAGSSGASSTVTFVIPNNYYYRVVRDTGCGVSHWIETTIP